MAKCIKRAGIVFFVLVLSLLLVSGAMIAVTSTIDNSNEVVGNTTASDSDERNIEYVDLGGATCAVMATNWNNIIQNAKSTGKAYVRLTSNWTAAPTADNTNTSFGEYAESFNKGDIQIPTGMHITIDLNGKTLNRNKTSLGSMGQIFAVAGKLTITDNSYSYDTLLERYEYVKNLTLDAQINYLKGLPIGKITGGWTPSAGGGIDSVSSTAEVEFNNGMIIGNKSNGNGGAVFMQKGSSFTMNGGIIIDNETNNLGGGIYITEGNLNLNGGIILGNTAGSGGAGIYSIKCNTIINDIIVTGNYSNGDGGAIVACGGNIDIYDCLITKNSARINCGGVMVTNYNYNLADEVQAICNIYGGEISYSDARYASGLFITCGAKCNMKDERIVNNHAKENGAGIDCFINTEFVMDGGVVENNFVEYYGDTYRAGAGVLLGRNTTFTMNGGKIINNKAISYFESTDNIIIASGLLIGKGEKCTVNLNGGTISGNISDGFGAGVACQNSTDMDLYVGGNIIITGNTFNGKGSDLYLNKDQKINFTSPLTSVFKIGIDLADDYGTGVFTTNFAASGNTNASDYFFSNNGAKIATINGGEVSFENSIESEVYDFVYLENGKRKNYKDNNLIHIVNDEQIKKQVNGGKLILGNILPNTSVNTFIQNINFDRTKVKLYDSNNKLIYDKGNSVAGVDSSLYDKKLELAVGTGWRLETYTASGAKIEEFALSVLGDSNGDGRISASDVTYIREIANDTELYNNLSVEYKLASLILNKGSVTSADSEIILNVIEQRITINLFY